MIREAFLCDDEGTTSVEYAVMLAMIIVVCIGALQFFGSTAGGSLSNTNTKINNAVGASS